MEINKTAKVEPLRDFDNDTFFTALKEKTIDTYENEIELSKNSLSIPKEIIELPIQAQYMLSFYNDRSWVNQETGKKTYNDIVESYIASLDDTKFINNLYITKEEPSQDGSYVIVKKYLDPEKKSQYMFLKQKAISYWNDNNLSAMIDIFKKLMLGGRKHEDMIKDEIVENALHNEDENIKLKYLNQAIKVLGLDKNIQMQGKDVWKSGGGKEFGSHASKVLNMPSLDISKYVDGEEDGK